MNKAPPIDAALPTAVRLYGVPGVTAGGGGPPSVKLVYVVATSVLAMARKVAPGESSGLTYHWVMTMPLAVPSRSPAPPSTTLQGVWPSPTPAMIVSSAV